MLSRIKDYLDFKGISVSAFEKSIGMSNASFGKSLKSGGTIGLDKLEKILTAFPDLNPLWVIKGELPMILDKTEKGAVKEPAQIYKATPVAVTIDETGKDNIVLVDVKAAAGYPHRHIEPTFLKDLPSFKLPGTSFRNGTFRAFEVEGDSMLGTLKPGEWVMSRLLTDISEIRDGYVHVVVTREEVTVKRIINKAPKKGKLTLISDNALYPSREIPASDVLEIWRGIAHLDFTFTSERQQLSQIVSQLQVDVIELKDRIQRIEKSK